MDIFIKNATIITNDKDQTVYKNGALYIKDDQIINIGKTDELNKEHSNAEKIIDARSRVIIPGMICGHMHFYSAFATGMPLPPFPKGFVNVLENLWWKLDKALLKDDVYYSALLGYVQAVRSGTTTVIDHHASPSYILGSLDEIENAGRLLGVRSNLCYEVTNRNSDEEAFEGLKENERFINKSNNADKEFMSGLLGLHAQFTVSDDILEKSTEIVEKYNTGVHIHVAEGKADMEQAKEKYNLTAVERLNKFNLLNEKSILAHCIHIEDNDYKIIKDTKANVVHQPRSNMNNAVGTLDIWKLQEYNIPFGLGTDGMSADMKAELLVTPLIHKHVAQDNTKAFAEPFDALFKTNPQILRKLTNVQTGSIEINKKADVLLTNYFPKSPITSSNVIGHMMFGVIHEPIATTIIDGKIQMEEGLVLGIDELELSNQCQAHAENVWARID